MQYRDHSDIFEVVSTARESQLKVVRSRALATVSCDKLLAPVYLLWGYENVHVDIVLCVSLYLYPTSVGRLRFFGRFL